MSALEKCGVPSDLSSEGSPALASPVLTPSSSCGSLWCSSDLFAAGLLPPGSPVQAAVSPRWSPLGSRVATLHASPPGTPSPQPLSSGSSPGLDSESSEVSIIYHMFLLPSPLSSPRRAEEDSPPGTSLLASLEQLPTGLQGPGPFTWSPPREAQTSVGPPTSSPPPQVLSPTSPTYSPTMLRFPPESDRPSQGAPWNLGTFGYAALLPSLSPPPRPQLAPGSPSYLSSLAAEAAPLDQRVPSFSEPSQCSYSRWVSICSPRAGRYSPPRAMQESASQTRTASGYWPPYPGFYPATPVSSAPNPRDGPPSHSYSRASTRFAWESAGEIQVTLRNSPPRSYAGARSPPPPWPGLRDAPVLPRYSPNSPRCWHEASRRSQHTPGRSQHTPGRSHFPLASSWASPVSLPGVSRELAVSPCYSPLAPRYPRELPYHYSPGHAPQSQSLTDYFPGTQVSSPRPYRDFSGSPRYSQSFPTFPGEAAHLSQETAAPPQATPTCIPTSAASFPRVLGDWAMPHLSSPRLAAHGFLPESAPHSHAASQSPHTGPNHCPMCMPCVDMARPDASLGHLLGPLCDPEVCSLLGIHYPCARLPCSGNPLGMHPQAHACPSTCYCHSVARRRGAESIHHYHPGHDPLWLERVPSRAASDVAAGAHVSITDPAAFMPPDCGASNSAGLNPPAWQ